MMKTTFTQLNEDWNAEPNAPEPEIEVSGNDILLRFYLNPFLYPQYEEDDVGVIRFRNCTRYRFGPENDEGWYGGQCRFSELAPDWGEFYEVEGDLKLDECPSDWKMVSSQSGDSRHFLFYFRDNMFECDAQAWVFEPAADNALYPAPRKRARHAS